MRRIIAAGITVLAFAGLSGVALAQEPTDDIVDTAIEAGSFESLVSAIQSAGLEDTLRGDGPFTVFAPTDAAFAAVPSATLNALLADTEALRTVLLYHVVEGDVRAADVVGLSEAETAGGEMIEIEVVDGEVILNGETTVTDTDILATNGVIHVIDSVLLPPSLSQATPTPTATATPTGTATGSPTATGTAAPPTVGTPSPSDAGNAGLAAGSTTTPALWLGLIAVLVAGGGAVAARALTRR